MSSFKDWDTPFGPSDYKEVVYPTTLDEIDQWLFDSFGILPGCCSSIESVRHTTARMVAEALWPRWISVDVLLPSVDKEVVVLTDIITKGGLNAGFGKIAFGHIVDKSVAIDYDGWNIPGVRYWMPMPEIPNKK